MAHHKDAIKRVKQSERRRLRNKHYKTRVRNLIKDVRSAIDDGDVEAAQARFRTAVSMLHRVAGKGIMPRATVARRIRRLNASVKQMAAPAE